MKRVIAIFCLLIAASLIGHAQMRPDKLPPLITEAIAGPPAMLQVVGGGGEVAAPADPCGSPTTTYEFSYTGDFTADTDKACFDSGNSSTDPSAEQNCSISASYIECPTTNDYVCWSLGEGDFDETSFTIFMNVYLEDADTNTDLDDNNFFEISDGGTVIVQCWTDDGSAGDGDFNCTYNGATAEIVDQANAYNKWWRLGYTVSTSGGDHAISLVACSGADCSGLSPSWVDFLDVISVYANHVDLLCIGENTSAQNSVADDAWVSDVIILQGFKQDDPL